MTTAAAARTPPATRPAAAPTVLRPRHQIPSTSSGQKVRGRDGEREPHHGREADGLDGQASSVRHEHGEHGPLRAGTAWIRARRAGAAAEEVLVEHAGDRDGQARTAVDRNAAKAPAARSAESSSPSAPGSTAAGSRSTIESARRPARQVGQVDAPEDAVERRAEVEARAGPRRSASCGGRPGRRGWCRSGRGRAAGPSCRGQSRQDERVGARRAGGPAPKPLSGCDPVRPTRRVTAGSRSSPRAPSQTPSRTKAGTASGGQLEPVLEGLHQGDRAHAARRRR